MPSLPGVAPARIGVGGESQGGGLALAVSALLPERVALCHAVAPFMCDIERALAVAGEPPYTEVVRFLSCNSEAEQAVRNTLRHVDNALLASRIRARTLVAVGLMDQVTPPSTAFAAYNAIAADKDIAVYPFAGHAVPSLHIERELREFASLL